MAAVLLVAAFTAGWVGLLRSRPTLLLAPMMNLTPCLLARAGQADQPEWLASCSVGDGSAAQLVESTLRMLQPMPQADAPWELGYTLQAPLLAMLEPTAHGWQVNQTAVSRLVRTVRDSSRPVVLYLFSTHFSADAPIEPILARDPANLAYTQRGALPVDTYYGQPVYPWSVARTDNAITHYREQVIDAVLREVCQLAPAHRDRIRGITLLGEVHQLFPDFESGMGFAPAYEVSDYSAVSAAAFRRFLQSRHQSISELNQFLGSDYASFEQIEPPGKDIRQQALTRFSEHIDAYASGTLPVTGWVHAPGNLSSVVKVFLDGRFLADAPVRLSRQDVRAAHPEFGSADLGWRHDLDFRNLAAGVHRLDMALARPGTPLQHLGHRLISIMDRQQTPPVAVAVTALPAMDTPGSQVRGSIDEPRNLAAYYFNPLAQEWQLFRQAQVLDYLKHFDQRVANSCMARTPRYTHQIGPHFNPGWDSGKYAVDASLQARPSPRMGISLYGEASYGSSFSDWLRQSRRTSYGVTEFHPVKLLDSGQLRSVLARHRQQGAEFLSFFLETRWQGKRVRAEPNMFSLDPDNPLHQSGPLYASMRDVLAQQGR